MPPPALTDKLGPREVRQQLRETVALIGTQLQSIRDFQAGDSDTAPAGAASIASGRCSYPMQSNQRQRHPHRHAKQQGLGSGSGQGTGLTHGDGSRRWQRDGHGDVWAPGETMHHKAL